MNVTKHGLCLDETSHLVVKSNFALMYSLILAVKLYESLFPPASF